MYYNNLFRYGGVNISIKIDFTLIIALLCLVIIFSTSAISATEINENNLSESIDLNEDIDLVDSERNLTSSDSNLLESDSTLLLEEKESTKSNNLSSNDLSANTTEKALESSSISDSKKKTSQTATAITIKKSTVVKGDKLYIYLKDGSGKAISGKNVNIEVSNKNYTRTTDTNGMASMNINLGPNNYNVSIFYDGDGNYNSCYKNFILTVAKISTALSVSSTTVPKGSAMYVYLKDGSSNALSGKTLTFQISGKNYTRTTDANGRAAMTLNLVANKYNVSVSFAGEANYNSCLKTFTITVPQNSSQITVSSTTVQKGSNLYAYLKDGSNKAISGQNVIYQISGKNYTRTTDANGRASIAINLVPNSYNVSIFFNGAGKYYPSNTSIVLTVPQLSTAITLAGTSIQRGKYLYAYLKDKDGKAISNKKLIYTFSGKNYTRTTDSNGRVGLQLNTKVGSYAIKVNFEGDSSYIKSSLSTTVKVTARKTVISIPNTSVIRGNYLYAYLKDDEGNGISGQSVVLKFDTTNFNLKTDSNGRVALKINTKLGKIPVKVTYAGTTNYLKSSLSTTITSYVAITHIDVASSSIKRGNYFNAYLRDSSNKGISGQTVSIKFASNTYSRTTDSSGKVSLFISGNPGTYATTVSFASTNSYSASSKSLTVTVLANTTAKIIAKDQTVMGEYSVRLVDNNGNPLANQTITMKTTSFNRSVGSGVSITKKTIVLNSDNIYNKATDLQFLNSIATVLRNNGYKVIVDSTIGPNAHCTDIMGTYSNVCVLCIFGGVDSGMFVDMSSNWYQNLLKKYNNQVVLGFTHTQRDLATETWLERAHDDDYSPANFTGLAYPGTYLNDHKMDYIYGSTATEIANNFLKYAVKGLSIGLNNTLPCHTREYTVTTNENGYATITNLSAGQYNVVSSFSNTKAGLIADSVTTSITVK